MERELEESLALDLPQNGESQTVGGMDTEGPVGEYEGFAEANGDTPGDHVTCGPTRCGHSC